MVSVTKSGYVYLYKTDSAYKLGYSENSQKRIKSYDTTNRLIHEIKTDDMIGIEKYWHDIRFASKRIKKEVFKLTKNDVAVFKSRKEM